MTLTSYARIFFSDSPKAVTAQVNDRSLSDTIKMHPDAISIQFFDGRTIFDESKKGEKIVDTQNYSHKFFLGATNGPEHGMMTTRDGQTLEKLPTYIIVDLNEHIDIKKSEDVKQQADAQEPATFPTVFEPAA